MLALVVLATIYGDRVGASSSDKSARIIESDYEGEAYVSKTFPSKETLVKAMDVSNRQGAGTFQYVGKTQEKDGTYHVFFKEKHGDFLSDLELVKLDTDVWAFQVGSRFGVLQK
jgi:hypothetical protein